MPPDTDVLVTYTHNNIYGIPGWISRLDIQFRKPNGDIIAKSYMSSGEMRHRDPQDMVHALLLAMFRAK